MLETADGLVSATLALGEDPASRATILMRLLDALSAPTTVPQLACACRAIAPLLDVTGSMRVLGGLGF
jgi:hypothetical protein